MEYFVTFLFVLLAGKATFMDDMNICWFIIEGIFLFVALQKRRIHKSDLKLLGKFSLIYIVFCTFRSFLITQLPLSYWVNDLIFLFKFMLPGFLLCVILRERTVHYLVRVMTDLAIISLPLYCLQLIAPDTVYDIGKAINLPYAHFEGYVNMIVFTFVKVHAIRNSGFSWEPGAFGFFLIMTLMLHWLENNFTYDKRAKLLTLAIVTTLSTTTYVAFIIVLLMFWRAKGVRYAKLLIFSIPFLCVLATSVPFLFDKILATYNGDMMDMKNIDTLSKTYGEMGRVMPLNRFGSMLFLWKTFGYQLVFGVANMYQQTVALLQNISISNGIFAFFAQFGMVGLGFLLYKAYQLFRKYVSVELSIYCLLVMLILGFGECVYISSFFLSFVFLCHYVRPSSAVEEVFDEEDPTYKTSGRRVFTLNKT